MKIFILNIASLFLTTLVLFSSVSFTVEKHLCNGHVFSQSLFGKAEGCGMIDDYCIATHQHQSVSKKNCCKDEIQVINGSLFKSEAALKLDNKQQQNVFAPTLINYAQFQPTNFSRIIQFKNYLPPPITKNLNILFRVFRI